jgi:hypothetical protein
MNLVQRLMAHEVVKNSESSSRMPVLESEAGLEQLEVLLAHHLKADRLREG